jgi:hypothetical protein
MPHRGLTVLANSELITRLRYRLAVVRVASGCVFDPQAAASSHLTGRLQRPSQLQSIAHKCNHELCHLLMSCRYLKVTMTTKTNVYFLSTRWEVCQYKYNLILSLLLLLTALVQKNTSRYLSVSEKI